MRGRRKLPRVVVGVNLQGQADLPLVGQALSLQSRTPRAAYERCDHRNQGSDNGEDNQQFQQSEATTGLQIPPQDTRRRRKASTPNVPKLSRTAVDGSGTTWTEKDSCVEMNPSFTFVPLQVRSKV